MNAGRPPLHRRLSLRISATILVMEIAVLGTLGWHYVARYWRQIDEANAAAIQIPGVLMGEGALRYAAVRDPQVIERLVGLPILSALVLEPDGRVFEASRPELVGAQVTAAVTDFEFALADPVAGPRIARGASGSRLTCLNPLFRDGRHIGWFHLRGDTRLTEERKRRLAWWYAGATALSVLLTWTGIMFLVGRMTGPRIRATVEVLARAQAGDLTARTHGDGNDEIGQLQRGVDALLEEIAARTRDRDAAAAALARSENDLRITLDSIGDGVIAADAQGQVRRINPVAAALIGWPADQAVGRPLAEIFRVCDIRSRQPLADPVARVLGSGMLVGPTDPVLLLGRDGVERRIADSAAPIRDGDGAVRGVVVVLRDVTREHALQERLRQSQMMDAIGQLAGGIAHDFNKMLTIILGACDLLALQPLNDRQQQPLDAVRDAAVMAADLTRKLLTLTRHRPGQVALVTLDLAEVVQGAGSLLRRAIDRRIAIVCETGQGPCPIAGNATLLQSALVNLGLNARDAMPEGGTLTFTVALAEGAADGDDRTGRHAVLRVADTGVGIPPELLPRIFEPFFTTKEVGKGTGLGLAMVFSTVRDHGGSIDVASTPGQGTVFTIRLPTAAATTMTTAEPGIGPQRGLGTVLVIDDEPSVRLVTRHLLEDLGYGVLCAQDGTEGLALLRQHRSDVVAVLLDLVMPGLGGRETYQRLRTIDPLVPVILCSGFDREGAIDEMLALGAGAFLQKPFRKAELARILDRQRRPPASGA